jgi:hypothetical protein
VTVIHISARRRLPIALLAALAAALAAVALVALTFALAGPLPALLLAVALPASLLATRARGRRGVLHPDTLVPRRQVQLRLADGSLRQGLVAPLDQPEGQLVLTAEGYVLAHPDGRVLYRL